jgi:hypothetical protein
MPAAEAPKAEPRDVELAAVDVDPQVERARAPREYRTRECGERRARADAALRGGDWSALERLAQQSACWARADTAVSLRMQALFEMGRYAECIALGSKAKSKVIKQWENNCLRAQQG